LECPDRGDTNDDGAMDISDAVYLLSALFVPGSPTPPAPYPDEGDDPTPDSLTPDCPPVGPVGPGAFFTIARGDDSNAPAGDYMIYDNIGWGSFWAMHASGSPPTVDFSVDIVVAVVRAFPNFEHCLDITSLEDDFVNTIIEVEHQRENLPCALYILPTTPYHIVRWENAQSATPSPLAVETLIDVCPLVCP
ncbi:MAG: hypothetical protein KDC38_15565, partial [Planctomycetes bacterium]|nr:hypothetical protein [Planctomycetota bacterium]